MSGPFGHAAGPRIIDAVWPPLDKFLGVRVAVGEEDDTVGGFTALPVRMRVDSSPPGNDGVVAVLFVGSPTPGTRR